MADESPSYWILFPVSKGPEWSASFRPEGAGLYYWRSKEPASVVEGDFRCRPACGLRQTSPALLLRQWPGLESQLIETAGNIRRGDGVTPVPEQNDEEFKNSSFC